jgi:asparagine synthase (glutamine-hydrolysing)
LAGLYITIDQADSQRLDSVASYMRFSDETESQFVSPSLSYVWLGHDDPVRFAPAVDPQSGVHVIVAGRLCWPTDVWQKAERMPFEGGTANRVILDRYLRGGTDAATLFNGAALVCVWDPRESVLHFWTDQFGYHPAFLAGDDPNNPSVLTTFPDAISADPQVELVADDVAMVEFLRAWRVTPPNTYYKNVKHVGAATHGTINHDGRMSRREYWQPFQTDFFPSLSDAADELASALRSAVGERLAIAQRPAMLVSGGADSRVMLYGTDDPKKISGINLYERPTSESAIAKALCDRIGAQYVPFQRDGDYYPRMQADNVRWSGAMWCTEDNHYLGVDDLITKLDADLVMTACTTDWLFKGYGLEMTYKQFLGKNLPIKKFSEKRIDGFLPNYPLPSPSEFAAEVDARMNAWFDGVPSQLTTDRDHLLAEDRRIRPACYAVSVSGQIMYRTYPYDTFLADSRIAECYSRIKASWKLNSEVWGLAAGIVCEKAGDIVDANHGWSVNASNTSKLIAFAKGWVARRISKRVAQAAKANDGSPPSSASWPEYGWYAKNSPTLQAFWRETSQEHREHMTTLWGSDPWSKPIEDWAAAPAQLFRILTLLQHWRQKD